MLPADQLQMIKTIIFSKLDPKDYAAFIFGSRATGKNEPYSDIDIGIEGKHLPSGIISDIQEAFEESDLPYKVDIVDFSTVREKFKTVAKQQIIPL